MRNITAYQWGGWSQYLLPTVVPNARPIAASLSDWAQDVITQLPNGTNIFVYHIDLTVTASVPHQRHTLNRELEKRGVTLINAEATNISKAFLQATCKRLSLKTTLAARAGDPDERLIIKTNANYCGSSEAKVDAECKSLLGLGLHGAGAELPNYQVLPRKRVASEIWLRSDLIVEKYIDNAIGLFFRVYWLCDHMVLSEVRDPEVLKKMPEGICRKNYYFVIRGTSACAVQRVCERVQRLADMMARLIRATQVQFATADVVVDDCDQFYCVDLNSTPFWGGTDEPDLVTFLHAGLML